MITPVMLCSSDLSGNTAIARDGLRITIALKVGEKCLCCWKERLHDAGSIKQCPSDTADQNCRLTAENPPRSA